MKGTKKIRGGFWNYFRRRDYSEEETNLFTLIKKIHVKLICHDDVLKGISDSRDIFEKNIEFYLGLLEIFRVDVEKTIYAYQIAIEQPSIFYDTNKSKLKLLLSVPTNDTNDDPLSYWRKTYTVPYKGFKVTDEMILNDVVTRVNNVNTEYPSDFYYGVRPTHDSETDQKKILLYYKILYEFLILEVKQLRDLQINLKKKLESISGKKSHWFSSMFIRLPDGKTTANLNDARESIRIKTEIKPIIKKFCNVSIDSFYDRFYNYIRKFKLNLSEHDKKKVMKAIIDIFNKISKAISNKEILTPDDLRPSEYSDFSDNSSDNFSDNFSDNSPDNPDNYLYEEIPGIHGGKRTKKTGRKKSRKIK